MQFQRSIFRFYKLLTYPKIRYINLILSLILIIIAIQKTNLRIHYQIQKNHYPQNQSYFTHCINKYLSLSNLNRQSNQFISNNTLLYIHPIHSNSTSNSQSCHIQIKQPSQITTSLKQLQNSPIMVLYNDQSLHKLSSQIKKRHNILQIQISIDMSKIVSQQIIQQFGIFPILIDHLQQQLSSKNITQIMTEDFTFFDSYAHNHFYNGPIKILGQHADNKGIIKNIYTKITTLFYVFYKIIYGSVFCGLLMIICVLLLQTIYIYILQIIFLFFIRAKKLNLFAPWIQNHLNVLRNNQNHNTKRIGFINAFFFLSLLIGIGINRFIQTFADLVIGGYYAQMNKIGILYLCIIQLLSLIILRTMTSIKYGPIIIILIYTNCYYMQYYYKYSLPLYFIQIGFYLSSSFLFYLLFAIQSKVALSNNNQKYKPTINRPRCMYFPNYNLGWHTQIPPLWTYFVPVYGRNHFNKKQLSYVDEQYGLLYGQLVGIREHVNMPQDEYIGEGINEQDFLI